MKDKECRHCTKRKARGEGPCGYHTKGTGGGKRIARPKPASPNGSGVIDALDVEIGTLEGRLEILRQARKVLAG